MNKKLIKKVNNAIKWIESLETTSEKQQDGRLGDPDNGFCCLGYGCHILNVYFDSSDEDSKKFAKKVGLLRVDGGFINDKNSRVGIKVIDDKLVYSLIDANDDAGLDFYEISTIIKDNLGYIFKPKVAKELGKYFNKEVINDKK